MIPVYKQNNASIPALGYGTWDIRGELAVEMVGAALAAGYRHIDTAQYYDNEKEVGKAIQQSSIAREEIFLTTKVRQGSIGKADFLSSTEQSLEDLGLDYVDLLLIHWPNRNIPLEESLESLQKAQDNAWAKHIGVSNFPIALLQKCLAAGIKVFTNQVEYHPFLDQSKLLAFMRQNDISLTAYSPIAQGKVIGNPTIKSIADTYGKHETQITLRWLMQQNCIAIPRTGKVRNLKANMEIFDFELNENEMAQISALGSAAGRLVNPAGGPDWD
ncbi:MAG: aldo/keto reductase [Bacteroidota bacterium]